MRLLWVLLLAGCQHEHLKAESSCTCGPEVVATCSLDREGDTVTIPVIPLPVVVP